MFESAVTWIIRCLSPLLGAGILFLTVPKLFRPPPRGLPAGQRLPGVSLEVAKNAEEVADIITNAPRPTHEIRRELRLDQYLVIPLYALLFVALGVWLTSRRLPFAAGLGVAVCALIALAAYFDRQENRRTFDVLDAFDAGALGNSLVERMRRASLLKWGFIAAALAVVSVAFFLSGRCMAVAFIYLLATVSFAIGISLHRPGIEWGFALMGLALLPTGEAIHFIP